MKKTWANAEVEELAINTTANGKKPNMNFDDEWVEIDGKWYLPGDGGESN